MFRHSLRSRGFTLIELLVVISIIGMLSSIVLVSLQNARTKAVNSRILQGVGQLKTQLELERTNTGYPNLLSSSNGVAFYQGMSTDMKKFVDDLLKQQGSVAPTGYPTGGASCSATAVGTTNAGVVISTNTTSCGAQPTEYAIYTALKPVGTAGYVCKDSKGGQTIETTGGMPGTPTVTCPGSVVTGGGGSPSVSMSVGQSYLFEGDYFAADVTWSATGADSCDIFWQNPEVGENYSTQSLSGVITLYISPDEYTAGTVTEYSVTCYNGQTPVASNGGEWGN